MYDRCVPPKRSMKRLPWWRRPIHETKLGVLGTSAGGTFFVLLIIEIVSTPWLLLALLALAAVGILFAVLLHFTRRERPPTIFG